MREIFLFSTSYSKEAQSLADTMVEVPKIELTWSRADRTLSIYPVWSGVGRGSSVSGCRQGWDRVLLEMGSPALL